MIGYYIYFIFYIFRFSVILFPNDTKTAVGIFLYVLRGHYNLFSIYGHSCSDGDTVQKFAHLWCKVTFTSTYTMLEKKC